MARSYKAQPRSLKRKASIGVMQDMEEDIRAVPWLVASFRRGDLTQLGNGEAKTQFELMRREGH